MVEVTGGPTGTIFESEATFTWSGSDEDGSVSAYYIGLDENPPTTKTTATSHTYTDIEEGHHTFYVMAEDDQQELSPVDSRAFQCIFAVPYIFDVYVYETLDEDGDSYLESWKFIIDVDVPNEGTAETSILLTDDEGNDWGSFGPFSFTGTETSDNVTVGPFTKCAVLPDEPPENVDFTFELGNGGNTHTHTVPVDDPYQPQISDIHITSTTDANSDGYYEEWYFEIDVDVDCSGTASTSIKITDSEGNDWGAFGPYTFSGNLTSDNLTIGPFTVEAVNPDNPPEDVEFSFELLNGGDQSAVTVPVCYLPIPYFYDIYTINYQDTDQDGYYEEWSFEIDVDVPYGGTTQTYIAITDDEGNDW
ncbi:hypothetical protein AMJ82_10485 [candidate division TA06 bacterium SM23_40]|uniref:Uncharacterized protein n=1 Tax=candidate division TA06 bacterium SM23_40 TaxID=1703774 RepID=A0A0S8G3H5_UNCT6|nr:MAG: hypothetical protein AMJ82_10485 [candidate division TA06 bacterium SM23_40]